MVLGDGLRRVIVVWYVSTFLGASGRSYISDFFLWSWKHCSAVFGISRGGFGSFKVLKSCPLKPKAFLCNSLLGSVAFVGIVLLFVPIFSMTLPDPVL